MKCMVIGDEKIEFRIRISSLRVGSLKYEKMHQFQFYKMEFFSLVLKSN